MGNVLVLTGLGRTSGCGLIRISSCSRLQISVSRIASVFIVQTSRIYSEEPFQNTPTVSWKNTKVSFRLEPEKEPTLLDQKVLDQMVFGCFVLDQNVLEQIR